MITVTGESTEINIFLFSGIIIAGILIILLPRKYALYPAILVTLYTTYGQIVEIGSFHFYYLRIIIIFGLTRILIRKELFSIKLNRIDAILFSWVTVGFIINMILWQTAGAFVYRLGMVYNIVGLYLFFRGTVISSEDIIRNVKFISISILPLTVMILIESYTGQNLFHAMGGVPEFSELRKGIPRAQGPFRHPILAGSFGATSFCLFVGLWFQDKRFRILALIGVISALIITLASNSSGPLMSLIIAFIALSSWRFRKYLKPVLWSIPIVLLILHLVMKAPVWNILTKLGSLSGGGGWHRAYLITQAVNHFDDWWLFGTTNTADWMPYTLIVNPDSADLTNQFIAEGVNGGILTMILFLILFIMCFRKIKTDLRCNDSDKKIQILLWSMGSALAVHIASFFSVSYFDQIIFYFYFLIAGISCISQKSNIESVIA